MGLGFPIFTKRMRKLATEGLTCLESCYQVSRAVNVPVHVQQMAADANNGHPQNAGQGKREGSWGHSDAKKTAQKPGGVGVGLGSCPDAVFQPVKWGVWVFLGLNSAISGP